VWIDMKSKFIVLVILLIVCLSSAAIADDTVFLGEGETVWPVESKEIEMVAETVLVEPGGNGWNATCIFILKNTGEATEVQVGFPDKSDTGPGADLTKGTIKNFRCFVDNKEIQVELKKGAEELTKSELHYPFAYVWKMFFEKGQERIVRNTYTFGGLHRSDGTLELNYILTSGALWKGEIKSALITFELGEYDPRFTYSIKPEGYVIKDHQVFWSFSDFEPEYDIEIGLSPLVQKWFEEVALYSQTDSIQILKRLLYEADWLFERGIPKMVADEFDQKNDQLIKRLEKYGNASRYKALRAIRSGKTSEATIETYKFLEELMENPVLSNADFQTVFTFLYLLDCCLDNLEIRRGFYEVLRMDVERELSCLDTIPDIKSRQKRETGLLKLQKDYTLEIKRINQLINKSEK
jgi:hypothetical protein